MRSLRVPDPSAPLRLDVFLTRALQACSRRLARQMIAAGAVRINGRHARKGVSVVGGDSVDVDDSWLAPLVLQPNPQLQVPILYEDPAVMAVDKPAGLPSHALRGDEAATIANFLLACHPEIAAVGRGPLEPGIVHRLDVETSGVLLVARTPTAYDALRRQFSEHRVRKEYRAVVHGDVTRGGEIRTPIAATRNRARVRVCRTMEPGGRTALTRVQPLERFGAFTLLAIEISTGVRHQIRVHLASIGHPVVGDRHYGPADARSDAPRHLLHAYRLGFTHPGSGQYTEVSSPLPPDFSGYLDRLRSESRTPSIPRTSGAPRRKLGRRTVQ